MTSIPEFQQGNTVQMTFVSSTAPDAAPSFAVLDENGTVVESITSVSSTTTAFYALVTMPNSDAFLTGEWRALSTFNSVEYAFIQRFNYRVRKTQANP